jgi:hypothetical protein
MAAHESPRTTKLYESVTSNGPDRGSAGSMAAAATSREASSRGKGMRRGAAGLVTSPPRRRTAGSVGTGKR